VFRLFTGLIRERGRIAVDPVSAAGGVRLGIEHSGELAAALEIGGSLGVAGVCLTVVALDGDAGAARCTSWVDLTPETLLRSTLGTLRRGDEVNLEPPLRAGDPLGGHLVQGHVDATAAVLGRRDLGDHRVLTIALPETLASALVPQGSVAVDGVSLTVAALPVEAPLRFEVALIPHTLAVSTLGRLEPPHRVNLEVDIIGKYVARILAEQRVTGSVAPTP
jgi:riboflavin synthase